MTNREVVLKRCLNWEVQEETSLWIGHSGNDKSAVDEQTAWAALGPSNSEDGLILHTSDGGTTWQVQTLPEDVPEGVKGIKGISRNEAWAVGLKGPVLHALDGGLTWTAVLPLSRRYPRYEVRGGKASSPCAPLAVREFPGKSPRGDLNS